MKTHSVVLMAIVNALRKSSLMVAESMPEHSLWAVLPSMHDGVNVVRRFLQTCRALVTINA